MQQDQNAETLYGLRAILFSVGARRNPKGFLGVIVKTLALVISAYIYYAATVAVLDPLVLVAIFLCLMLSLLFLVVGATQVVQDDNPPAYDIGLSIIALGIGVYFVFYAETIITRISLLDPLSPTDIAASTLLWVMTVEATRRTVGFGLTAIVGIMMVYNLWGDLLPGTLAHGLISYEHFLDQTVFTTNGIFGAPLRVAATYAFLFVTFGTFLEKSGGGDFFFDLAAVVSGRKVGGPAKVAVISSALFGTISGSPTSDVVTTGSITIPMMRRLGYPRALAGAIEVAASTSGGLLPPIMASAAFIMVEVTGIPYLDIAKAAIIPAFLYLLGVFVQVHFLSKKLNLKPMDPDDIPLLSTVIKEGGLFILPLVILVAALFNGYSISYVAIFGTVGVYAVSLLRRQTRLGFFAILDVFITATLRMVPVTAACAAAGLVVGGISMTGLSGKLALIIFEMAGNGLIIALLVTAAITILLGMGMPTPSAYIMAAVLTAPILIKLGVPMLNAHFFLLFFSVLSALTPPVAVAAYAASSLAEANPLSIASRAVGLAAPAFVIPFIFVFRAELLGQGTTLEILGSTLSASIGVAGIAICIAGYFQTQLTWRQRCLGIIGSFLLLLPGLRLNLLGIAILGVSLGWASLAGFLTKSNEARFPKKD